MLEVFFKGFCVADVTVDDTVVHVTVSATSGEGTCPDCGSASHAVHSRYERMLHDLPMLGRQVEVHAVVRRYRS